MCRGVAGDGEGVCVVDVAGDGDGVCAVGSIVGMRKAQPETEPT